MTEYWVRFDGWAKQMYAGPYSLEDAELVFKEAAVEESVIVNRLNQPVDPIFADEMFPIHYKQLFPVRDVRFRAEVTTRILSDADFNAELERSIQA